MATPLLVPAFSSKGFAFVDGVSDIQSILRLAANFVTGVYLISAYDIQRGHIPPPADLPMKPELIILDSGGYEISEGYDLSAVNRSPPHDTDWSVGDLEAVLDDWPPEIPAVFVSYDHPKQRIPVADQIARARDLFRGRDGQLHCLLIKPENPRQRTLASAIDQSIARAGDLRSFDLIGVTEKELGQKPIDRMVQIARLRRALNEAHANVPIHVFGSLDPVSALLYFLSGAEVFDGLTWIRYAFSKDDRCLYLHNHATLEYGILTRDTDLRRRVLSDNYYYLENLQDRMKDYKATGDFTKLPHAEMLENACDKLKRRLSEGAR